MNNCVITLIVTIIICSVLLCCLSSAYIAPLFVFNEKSDDLALLLSLPMVICMLLLLPIITITYGFSSIIPIISCAFVNETIETAILLFSFMLCSFCTLLIGGMSYIFPQFGQYIVITQSKILHLLYQDL